MLKRTGLLPGGRRRRDHAICRQASPWKPARSAPRQLANALPALLPVGLGERGGEINQIFRNAFDRTVLNGEDVAKVLAEEGANLQKLMDETGAPCWAPDPPSDGPCQVAPR